MTLSKQSLAAKHETKKSNTWINLFSVCNCIATVCVVLKLVKDPQWNTSEYFNWGFVVAIAANCYIRLLCKVNCICFALHLVIILAWSEMTTPQQVLLALILCYYIKARLLSLTLSPLSLSFIKKQLKAECSRAMYHVSILTGIFVMCATCCQKNYKMHKNEALLWLWFGDNWMHQLLFNDTRVIANKLVHTCSNFVLQTFYLFLCIAANPTNTED